LRGGKHAGRRLTHRAESTCNVFAFQAAWPRRTNIPPDAESTVRNIAPATRPTPLTHDECLRILAGAAHRAIPQNVVFFWNVAEVSQESACRLASVQVPFAGATGHEPGDDPMKKLLFAGAISGNWTGKIEYLYVDLGAVSGSLATNIVTPAGNNLIVGYSSHVTDNILRAGVNYQFH
jgi:hypothetical protein